MAFIFPRELPFGASAPYHEEILAALEGTFLAAKATLEVYALEFKAYFKTPWEPVTAADLKSNSILLAALEKTGIPALSEETKDDGKRLQESTLWIIDPLDGTKEFIKRNDEFVIMIALVEQGVPVVGIVHQPVTGLLYLAQKGQGAFEKTDEGWKKLQVSSIDTFPQARAMLSKSHFTNKDRDFIAHLGLTKFIQKGSAGLKVGQICAGEADFYFNPSDKLKEWDTAACYCLVTEAGGKITDIFGKELKYNQPDFHHHQGILISNTRLHQQLVERLKRFYG